MASKNKNCNGNEIGIMLVCHSDLAEHFLDAAELICQCELDNIVALTIKANYDRGKMLGLLEKKLAKLGKSSKKIMVLCDAKGATASRIIDSGINVDKELQCVYGLNLPMLMECINLRGRTQSLEELAQRVCEAGRGSICAGDTHPCGDGH